MMDEVAKHFAQWRANPRRWNPQYVASSCKAIAVQYWRDMRAPGQRIKDLVPPIQTEYVELLHDREFRQSVAEVMPYTCQDIARLANIWTVVKGLGQGTYLEVGSYQGGTALHICNAMPQVGSKFYCVDPFETGSFEHVHSWEKKPAEFTDTRQDAVVALLSHKHFAQVVPGFFPSAIEPMNLKDIVFCHLDVNMYEATRKSLDFLVQRIAPHGCIIVDDYGHSLTPGVNRAVEEFLAEEPHFRSIPLFPCQVLLLAKGLR